MQSFRLNTRTSVTHTHTHTHTHTIYIYILAYTYTRVHTRSTCTDLQYHSVEVGPVHQEVMWSVREDSQHAGYMQTLVAHLSSDTEHKLGMGRERMSKWEGILDIACLEILSSV